MTDIGEMIAPPLGHTDPNKDCPFCPPPEPPKYTTHPGSANNSSVLADVMETPSKLVSLQGGARPQTGKENKDGYAQEQTKPAARNEDKSKWYTHQAHHLISGNQALKGSDMEDWILASKYNDKDTGYSVNCTGNGFWAPSTPKDLVGKWGAGKGVLSDKQRQEHAEKVMDAAGAQIHIGPHNISDPDDPDGHHHLSYDKYLKKKLKEISDRIHLWSDQCYLCKPEKGKPQATHEVHNVLDRLSNHMQGELKGPRQNWRTFISKYARDYHKPVCGHLREKT